jgi:flagellar FliL protein
MAGKKVAKPEAVKGKGEMSMAQTAIAFVVAGVIAGGVGAFAGMQNTPAEPPVTASTAGKTADRKNDEDAKAPVVLMGSMDIPPVVTNLSAPKEVWVRIEGSILFEGKILPHGDVLAAQISSDILAFLRTQTLEQIQGVAGLQHLISDITERVQTRSEGQVKKFIIKALVVQ